MMLGPSFLLDKSAFQSLPPESAHQFNMWFTQLFPPILAYEILGDLEHTLPSGHPPETLVAALAGRFFGSGPPLCYDFRDLCISDAQGHHVPMHGQIPIMGATTVPEADGTYGMLIEPTDTNLRLLEWARGRFTDQERLLAQAIQTNRWGISPVRLEALLDELLVVVPRPKRLEDVPQLVRDLLRRREVAAPLLRFLLTEVGAHPDTRAALVAKWVVHNSELERFSPFGHHCLMVTLVYVFARRWQMVPVKPQDEDAADLEYLFYMPFARLVSSWDRLHRRLAPLFLRPYQEFISFDALREDLAARKSAWDALDDAARARRAYSFGMYPEPVEGSIVSRVYSELVGPWPGGGSSASDLAPEERTVALSEARRRWESYVRSRQQAPGAEGE